MPDHVLAWLLRRSDGGHLVYAAFGTSMRPTPRMVREMLRSMAELEPAGIRFLWDFDAEEAEKHMRDEAEIEGHAHQPAMPANVLFAPRVDQLAVLASGGVDAFVSHCGLNSVHEALHFGVPIVAVPFLGDQLVTGRLVEEAEVGERLSVQRLTAADFAEVVRRLVSEERYTRAALRVGSLGRLAGGARAAADAIEGAVNHGTVHLLTIADRHPAAGRTWDVQAALVASVVAIIGICLVSWRSLSTPAPRLAEAEATPSPRQSSGAATRKKRA